MTAVTLRGLLTRKLRTALTMIAIILGVSMISGTYVLTDTINSAFLDIFNTADRGIDAVVVSKAVVSSQFSTPPAMPASLLSVVQGTPGVAQAEGEIGDQAQLFDLKGNSIGSTGGAPTLLFSVAAPRFRQTTLVSGHWPHGNELVMDKDTFAKHHLRLGQQIKVASNGPAQTMTLVGTTRFGTSGNIGGATTVDMELATAQRVTGKVGKFDEIVVGAASGISPQQVVQRIRARIPSALRNRTKVETGTQNASDASSAIGKALSFLTIALLAFGGIAVFVGAFIIFNTFSITVAQRAREFGLLRTLGSTRSQVLRSVVFEALLIGVLSSIIGLLAGLLIAEGLNSVFKSFGIDLPTTHLVVQTRTIVVALLVGTVVTLLAGLVPAIRATQVPPIAALREGAQLPRGRWGRFVPFIAAGLGLLAIALLVWGIFGSISTAGQRLSIIGLGALLLFVAVAMISPQVVGPLAGILGWPIERLTSITGRLARENAVRNPGRTAVTAAALMIGLALVGFVTIFAAELRKSADDAVNREIAGTFSIYSDTGILVPHSLSLALTHVPGVATVSALNGDVGKIMGAGTTNINGIQPATILKVYRFQWKQGSNATVSHMGPNDALVSDTFASDHKVGIASPLRVTTTVGRHDTFRVIGIYKSAQILGGVTIRHDTFARDWAQPRDQIVSLTVLPGQNLTVVQNRIDTLLKSQYPQATSHSQAQIKQRSEQNVNQLLGLIYVLLAMSVLVSLFGIINTLVLSVYERTREIGMLRAIGTTRGQIRWIIRWESVITAVIGAVLGLVIGIVLAALITQGLSSQGIEFTLPIGQLLIWVVFAIVFGIVAAAFPARRAARLDVLQAIAYE
ncbi:MAG TPA: FtsX-like permease family protein [Chloroflexota bacterium]